MGWFLARTRFGRIVRATAENREMAEAMGVDMARVYSRVFTLGVALGTVGGALVIPATAAVNEMGIDLIVEAFAVVVIGGLRSMRGALAGAPLVGVGEGGGPPPPPGGREAAPSLILLPPLVP